MSDTAVTTPLAPPEGDWPKEDLESVEACPVCGGKEREIWFDGLQDRVFFHAPGTWILKRCASCRSGYLDPRPTAQSIGRAYAVYYTHDAPQSRWEVEKRLVRRIRDLSVYGYLNAHFGYRFPHRANRLVSRVYMANSRRVRVAAERRVRHLALPTGGGRLLDIGCGNGDFLHLIRQAGWNVSGIDPDPQAVAACQSVGLDVRQGFVEDGLFEPNTFDAVTMSHVIEHLHQPTQTLAKVRQLLKPGGTLWIATPNVESASFERFGRNWLGLDPPRHLVLFTPDSLLKLLHEAGFETGKQPFRSTRSSRPMYEASAAIERGDDPRPYPPLPPDLTEQARRAQTESYQNPRRDQEMIVLAIRPRTA